MASNSKKKGNLAVVENDPVEVQPLSEDHNPEGSAMRADGVESSATSDLLDEVDAMLSGTPKPAEDKQPFINCKEFHLIGMGASQNRVYNIVGLADGAIVSDTVTQSHALGTTNLEQAFNQLSAELVKVLFPKNPTALIKSFTYKAQQNKKKEQVTKVAVTAEDNSGAADLTIKNKPVEAKLLGSTFAAHYTTLQSEVLTILRDYRDQGGVQQNLFDAEQATTGNAESAEVSPE